MTRSTSITALVIAIALFTCYKKKGALKDETIISQNVTTEKPAEIADCDGQSFNREAIMPLTKGFHGFKAGCLSFCEACGSHVFDPDGFYFQSIDCHTPPETGKWRLKGNTILACLGSSCDKWRQKSEQVITYETDKTGKIYMTEANRKQELSVRMLCWVPSDWEGLPGRSKNLKSPY